ncbi:MAG: hypothetical protein RL518_2381 [Pseudomonadota bacterium]|jgi:hypothetical protein
MKTEVLETRLSSPQELDRAIIRARRTAFVARFIVLREGKRTKAHRVIEMMDWEDLTTVEELAHRFRSAFEQNGDNMFPVDRDLRRAVAHSFRSIKFFVSEYALRATTDFVQALVDYERSNQLLFSDDDAPKPGGWRLPREIERQKAERALGVVKKPRGRPSKRAQSVPQVVAPSS